VSSVTWKTHDRSEVYVRDAIDTLFVKSPIYFGGVVAFETIANVRDVYEVRASFVLTTESE